MEFDVYCNQLEIDDAEKLFEDFRKVVPWVYEKSAKLHQEDPRIWRLGFNGDNDINPKEYYVLIDKRRIITRGASGLVRDILMGNRSSHEKYSGIEISKDDLMNKSDISIDLNSAVRDYIITFDQLK